MSKKHPFFQPSNAEKAFVYQQTQDLVSHLNHFGPVSVLLEKDERSSTYIITFALQTNALKVLARSEGENLLDVCISAKNEMKKKLALMTFSMEDSLERTAFIDKLKKNPYLH